MKHQTSCTWVSCLSDFGTTVSLMWPNVNSAALSLIFLATILHNLVQPACRCRSVASCGIRKLHLKQNISVRGPSSAALKQNVLVRGPSSAGLSSWGRSMDWNVLFRSVDLFRSVSVRGPWTFLTFWSVDLPHVSVRGPSSAALKTERFGPWTFLSCSEQLRKVHGPKRSVLN